MRRVLSTVVLLSALGCKVPITDIRAAFSLADATWFEEEQTLFFFYRVEAEQGIGEDSSIEVTWRTDDVDQPWTELQTLPQIHTHLPVDCGVNGRCGSGSVKVEKVPRLVGIRLRYHREGQLFLTPVPTYNVVGLGPPNTNRSLLIYGVFDQTNTRVQWRARHNFPTQRNEQAQLLGLRRDFRVLEPGYGDVAVPMENPYGYGFMSSCGGGFTPLGWTEVQTNERAEFAIERLPLAASTAPAVCARTIVTDAKGTFEAPALARKNPEVRPAFPELRSPIRDDLAVGFVLKPCNREISKQHLDMQLQRLQLEGAVEICIDDFEATGFASTMAARFKTRFDAARLEGRDMVLTIALHHDDTTGKVQDVLEAALEQVLPTERDKTSPRVSGAFVFDSFPYRLKRVANKRTVLWCPAKLPPMIPENDLDLIPSAAERSCPVLPDFPELKLGPFSFNTIPILPSRPQYLTFVEKYSEAQAGRTTKLELKAPELTPVSQNVALGEFGVASFFNNESITAAPADAFSFCQSTDPLLQTIVVRVPQFPDQVAPVSLLPDVQEQFPQPQYNLGIGWDFPFLTRIEYQVVIAGAATAFSVTVPFGIAGMDMRYFGTELWKTGVFPTADLLAHCTRFCDNPTFDSSGVYNVQSTFRGAFKMQCYRPAFHMLDVGGFPLDP